MNRGFLCSCMGLCLTLILCGCGSWLDGSYSSVEPHLADNEQNAQSVSVASSYIQLRQALVDLVESGRSSGIISVDDFEPEVVNNFMEMAIEYATTENAIGAYALDEITYELGTNAGVQAVAVSLTYTHGRSEILKIRQVDNMTDGINLIYTNLNNCTAGIVIKVNDYTDVDFTQLIEDYVDENPQAVMEMPQVSAVVYPEWGKVRVIDVSFTYQSSREDLRSMQEKVRPIFTAAELYVRETTDVREKFAQLYSFLMERYEQYTVQTSITPSYSLLMYGVGDSEAFANVYSAMCVQSGLDCQVISGTRNSEPWSWNLIYYDGVYYHVDLLRCSQTGGFLEQTEEKMGDYVWDYSAYGSYKNTEEE